MAIDIDAVRYQGTQLRDHYHTRDARWTDLHAIRQGNIQQVFPEHVLMRIFLSQWSQTSLTLPHAT
jgi:hypothetical protein